MSTATAIPTHVRAKLRQSAGLPKDTLEFVASTEQVASDGLVIRRRAWDRTIARGQGPQGWWPRFLAGHSHKSPDGGPPPIGKILSMRWEDGTGLVIRVQFAPADVNPLGPRYLKAYRDAFMTDVSVSWGQTKLAEEREWETDGVPEVVDLLCDEVSAVTVGADFGAKKRAAEAGFADLVPDCGTCARAEDDEMDDEGGRMIVKDHEECGAGKYALVDKDGKVLGCHDDEASAKEQEAALKANENGDDMEGEQAKPAPDAEREEPEAEAMDGAPADPAPEAAAPDGTSDSGGAAPERTAAVPPVQIIVDLGAVMQEIAGVVRSLRETCDAMQETAQRMEVHAARMAGTEAGAALNDDHSEGDAPEGGQHDNGSAALADLQRLFTQAGGVLAEMAGAANGAGARQSATEG